ncbi:MAG: hypothetical protein JJE52_12800 [Acidimicrobiia bacterium]|nr:hypothetical protein [Acidimicrobiia bacterium]
MSETPSDVGATAEREVACALVKAGWSVYVPMFAPHSRVDLVADVAGRLLRVQVKSARLVRQAVTFTCCSYTANIPKEYVGEVDVFGVYCPSLGMSYLVPIGDVPTRLCTLRLVPPRNNQVQGVRWAADYEIRPAL